VSEKCQCRIEFSTKQIITSQHDKTAAWPEIIYCPTHAAAFKMLAALEKARELAEAMAEAHDRSNRELKRAGILPRPDSHAPDYLRKARELLALLPPRLKTDGPETEGLVKEGSDAPTP